MIFTTLNLYIILHYIGDLCNENQPTSNGSHSTPNCKRKTENGKPTTAIYGHINQEEITAESCSVNTATKLMMAPLCVSKKDRNKFCGSLPNHLDADDVYEENGNDFRYILFRFIFFFFSYFLFLFFYLLLYGFHIYKKKRKFLYTYHIYIYVGT